MHRRTPIAQQLLPALHLFQVGALYSLGVFAPAVETSAPLLAGLWARALVFMSLVGTPAMILSSIFVASAPPHAATARVATLVFIAALSLATLAAAAAALHTVRPLLLQTVVVVQGIAYGILYLIGIELLAAWNPAHPGLAIGMGQMVFGLGSMFYSTLFASLLDYFPTTTALLISSTFLAGPTILTAPFVKWPSHARDTNIPEAMPNDELDQDGGLLITLRMLPFLPQFWCYVATVFALQPGFAFIPYFFKIGLAFGQNMHVLTEAFNISFLFGTILRPLAGALADSFKLGEGHLAMGSRNFMGLLIILQLILYFALVPMSGSQSFFGFAFCSGTIMAIFAAGSCGAATLARDIFGPQNSSLIFGVGAGTAMGLGEFVGGGVLSMFDRSDRFSDGVAKYIPFYLICTLWSALGFISCVMIRKHTGCSTVDAECAKLSAVDDKMKRNKMDKEVSAQAQYGAMVLQA